MTRSATAQPDRFALLYDVLWRVIHGERDLAERASDPHVARLIDYCHSRAARHSQDARLPALPGTRGRRRTFYTAWFEPHHHILRRAVPFFVDRFSNMDFVIATPRGTAIWRDGSLAFGPPGRSRPMRTATTCSTAFGSTYFRTTFNPARLRLKTMVNHMPRDYWNNMPETAIIPDMVAARRTARHRDDGHERGPARTVRRPYFGAQSRAARAAGPACRRQPRRDAPRVRSCPRCPLYKDATQTVFGEGPRNARWCLSANSRATRKISQASRSSARPGKLFDRAIGDAGLDRAPTPMSPTRSSISNTSRAASAGSTRGPMRAKSGMPLVARGRTRRGQAGSGGRARRDRGAVAVRSRDLGVEGTRSRRLSRPAPDTSRSIHRSCSGCGTSSKRLTSTANSSTTSGASAKCSWPQRGGLNKAPRLESRLPVG